MNKQLRLQLACGVFTIGGFVGISLSANWQLAVSVLFILWAKDIRDHISAERFFERLDKIGR